MRVRRHHAWGVILIALFALPVLKPDGIPALERPVGSLLGWFGRVPALNPKLWQAQGWEAEGGASAREQALELENASLRERFAERLQLQGDWKRAMKALQEAGLDRKPRALFARVLRAKDPSGYRQSMLIDRGAMDGLVPGLAVASGSVFLGRVEVVYRRCALVELLTDRQSRLEVAFRTDRNVRLTGYVKGEGRSSEDAGLEIRHVRLEEGIGIVPVGTPVVTSNVDPLVPPGLIVGRITDVFDKDLDGLPRIEVRPALDVSRATQVLVLLPSGDVPPRR